MVMLVGQLSSRQGCITVGVGEGEEHGDGCGGRGWVDDVHIERIALAFGIGRTGPIVDGGIVEVIADVTTNAVALHEDVGTNGRDGRESAHGALVQLVVDGDDVLIDGGRDGLGVALIVETDDTIAFVDHGLDIFVVGMLGDLLETKVLEIYDGHVLAVAVFQGIGGRKGGVGNRG